MAWPEDAVDVNYGPLDVVSSDNLNEIQLRIVDCHRVRAEIRFAAYPKWNSNAPAWEPDDAGSMLTWKCITAGATGILYLPFEAREAVVLVSVDIKFYLATATGLTFQLYLQDDSYDVAATAPAWGSGVAGAGPTTPTLGAYPGWGVVTLTPTSEVVLTDQDRLMVWCTDPDANDEIASARWNMRPIDPT
jgi:hypothetical protein